jgi:hypothetical protein
MPAITYKAALQYGAYNYGETSATRFTKVNTNSYYSHLAFKQ